MYTRYFGLRENPFALPPDPRYLYLAPRYQEALAHLLYGISQGGGFVQLTGEVGTGKTMMIRALLERLPPEVNAALILYPLLSVEEFVASICDDLGIPSAERGSSLKGAIDALNRFLLENHAKGRRTVIIIDEAHRLSHEVLEQVRLLTNLETTKEKLLQILLVGQPELTGLLAQPNLRQLAQRITARYNLGPLTAAETAQYVRRRLEVAGAKGPIFTPGALRAVHRLAGGIPRLINTFCDRALLGAYAHGRNRVTAALLRRAAAEVGYRGPRRYGARAALAAGLVAAAAIGAWQWRLHAWPPLAAETAEASATVDAAARDAAPLTADAAPAAAAARTAGLTAFLAERADATDTENAFKTLFAKWNKDYARLAGATGCERAERAGLRCLYASGTWNNLRQLNRPAILELTDDAGTRHQVVVTALADDRVALEIANETREFPLTEVERYWYGKYLTLWKPPPSGELALRIGMEGPAVAWLRAALARYRGEPDADVGNTTFDAALRAQVREFQRAHRLEPDGVAGRQTLIHLDAYGPDLAPPPLTRAAAERGGG
ncbi:MAG TPA: AAA family ATPase [Burkholderiales bacterium]